MPFKPVDQAIQVILGPCIDDTDFKTREELLTYNQAGMEITVILEKHDGTVTTTAVTPTTGDDHDWAHTNQGYYSLEIPASAGDYNNDTEGILHVVGYCTGVLPFRSPAYDIVPEKVYNSLVEGSDNLEVDTVQLGGTTQSATDLKDFADTGYNPATHIAQSDLVYIHGSALTETAGQLAGRFVDFFDQASATFSVATALSSFKATGFSTHNAADVLSALGTGDWITAAALHSDYDAAKSAASVQQVAQAVHGRPVKFVATTGNDSNDGTTPALAKLTVQAMVTAASDGDLILVFPGTYTETVNAASRSMALRGAGPATTITYASTADTLTLGSNTELSDITIVNTYGDKTGGKDAIAMSGKSNIWMDRVTATANQRGCDFGGVLADKVYIADCHIRGGEYGVAWIPIGSATTTMTVRDSTCYSTAWNNCNSAGIQTSLGLALVADTIMYDSNAYNAGSPDDYYGAAFQNVLADALVSNSVMTAVTTNNAQAFGVYHSSGAAGQTGIVGCSIRATSGSGTNYDLGSEELAGSLLISQSNYDPDNLYQSAGITDLTTGIKDQTDLLSFTGTDVKATLDGEEVVTDSASRTASKADVSALATSSAVATMQADVTSILTDTGTTIPGTITTLQADVTSIVADTGTDGVVLSTTTKNAIADAFLDRSAGVETGVTPRQYMQRSGAIIAGKISGAGTGTEVFVGMDGSTTRVTVTVDDDGNRTAITYDA